MSTIDHDAIAQQLATIELVHGVGTDAHHACTISALNIALTGKLTDQLNECMSPVIHRWVIRVQDAMPVEMMRKGDEHGDRWRAVAPFIAGSASTLAREKERVDLLVGWMWACLAYEWESWVPVGVHDAWRTMLSERTAASARKARDAAAAAAAYATATATAYAAADADAAAAAAAYADADADASFWRASDPAGLLANLVK